MAPRRFAARLHYGVSAIGVPNAWDFYHVADNATQKDQDIFASGSIDNQTTAGFHQQRALWPDAQTRAGYTYGSLRATSRQYYRLLLRPRHYSANLSPSPAPTATQRPARLCSIGLRTYPERSQNVSTTAISSSITATSPSRRILAALIGFQYEDERGAEPGSTFYPPVERTQLRLPCRRPWRLQESLLLFAWRQPRALFALRCSDHAARRRLLSTCFARTAASFSGTRILFNYGDAVREPTLTDQDGSLYRFLAD